MAAAVLKSKTGSSRLEVQGWEVRLRLSEKALSFKIKTRLSKF
jgi:hypothetical protein